MALFIIVIASDLGNFLILALILILACLFVSENSVSLKSRAIVFLMISLSLI